MLSLIFIDALYAVSGLFVGAIVGPTGVGCGSLITPLLILLFGVHPEASIATDLHFVAFTKTAGSAVNGFNKSIDWLVVQLLALQRAWCHTSKSSTIKSPWRPPWSLAVSLGNYRRFYLGSTRQNGRISGCWPWNSFPSSN